MTKTYGASRTFDDGEVIFREGDEGDEMFIIAEGAVRISRAKRSWS